MTTPTLREQCLVPVADLVPYARNARTHSPAQVAQLAASIREFGWTNPVLIDETGGIIAGHGRVLAAREVGMHAVPCLRLTGLTDAQKRAYVLADNQLALNAGWDEALLAEELSALGALEFDLGALGFSPAELSALLGGGRAAPSPAQIAAAEEQAAAGPPSEPAFQAEMARTDSPGLVPILPLYAEHHTAVVIICDNTIDQAWLRQRLRLPDQGQSYKDSKIQPAHVLTVAQLREALA